MRGLSFATRRLLEVCQKIVKSRAPITVRGVAYQLFVRQEIPSMAVGETQKVSRLLVYAREHDIIAWDDIVDETRAIERAAMWRDLPAFGRTVAAAYRRDYWASQPVNVQVWSEKATVGGILRPVTEKYGVPFMAVHGFSSATALHDAAEASVADPRPLTILYCGDHDPSGMYMSEVDLSDRFARYGGRVTIKRIALAANDLDGLPSFPAKPTDPRFAWYRSHFGTVAWELDAMDPNILRDLIEGEILDYIDPTAWGRMKLVEAAEQRTVERVAAALRDAN